MRTITRLIRTTIYAFLRHVVEQVTSWSGFPCTAPSVLRGSTALKPILAAYAYGALSGLKVSIPDLTGLGSPAVVGGHLPGADPKQDQVASGSRLGS
jgi:hypothetical protein